jgi:hypothetical protein
MKHAKRTNVTADYVNSALSLRNVEVPFLPKVKKKCEYKKCRVGR